MPDGEPRLIEPRVVIAGGAYQRSWFVVRLALAFVAASGTRYAADVKWSRALLDAEKIADSYALPAPHLDPVEAP